jgi:hypothetical protein
MDLTLIDTSPRAIEWAYGNAMRAQRERRQSFADVGMRAARARDPKLLYVLERGAEVIAAESERQTGRHRRDPSTPFGERVEHTEAQLWREAYLSLADRGQAELPYEWIYGAAALLCGYGG